MSIDSAKAVKAIDRIRCGTDAIRTHNQPVDKMAAKVVFGNPAQRFTSPICPSFCPVSVREIQKRVSSGGGKFRDLTGQRLGKILIIGLHLYQERRRSIWIAKCDCGNFEQRNHRFWQKYYRYGMPDACLKCVSLDERAQKIKKILGDKAKKKMTPRDRWKL